MKVDCILCTLVNSTIYFLTVSKFLQKKKNVNTYCKIKKNGFFNSYKRFLTLSVTQNLNFKLVNKKFNSNKGLKFSKR